MRDPVSGLRYAGRPSMHTDTKMAQSPQLSATSFSASQAAKHSPLLMKALHRNEAAKGKIEQTAEELVVINAVLKHELPDEVQTGDVAKALDKTDRLEAKINETAEDLAEVNKTLTEEIIHRINIEKELKVIKDELARDKVD